MKFSDAHEKSLLPQELPMFERWCAAVVPTSCWLVNPATSTRPQWFSGMRPGRVDWPEGSAPQQIFRS
ncbi:hypothetical protein ABW18_12540 [Gordonia jacobaea]|uniref:Uncharacterized protein n=1 Tax=Gordonia jacobaea TaxID=122202 RepID=A0ABR5IBP9_9ACTN|nr:hypothetical protein ABW18_12540 [Gordonia jacobaea]